MSELRNLYYFPGVRPENAESPLAERQTFTPVPLRIVASQHRLPGVVYLADHLRRKGPQEEAEIPAPQLESPECLDQFGFLVRAEQGTGETASLAQYGRFGTLLSGIDAFARDELDSIATAEGRPLSCGFTLSDGTGVEVMALNGSGRKKLRVFQQGDERAPVFVMQYGEMAFHGGDVEIRQPQLMIHGYPDQARYKARKSEVCYRVKGEVYLRRLTEAVLSLHNSMVLDGVN